MNETRTGEHLTSPPRPNVAAIAFSLTVLAMIALSSFAQTHQGTTTAIQMEAFRQLPLYFVENRGQLDDRVAYYVQGRDKTLYFTSEGITVALVGPREPEERSGAEPAPQAERPAQRWVVTLEFLGANPEVQPIGLHETPAVISYFKGQPMAWKVGLRTYATVVYPDLWPGIDLELSGVVNQLKYQFVVKPGVDPSVIRLVYRGATEVRLNEIGQLELSTPLGGFHDERPYAHQEVDGRAVEVDVAYVLEDTEGEAWVYTFRLGPYDTQRPLVLDPAMLVYCGYIGGAGNQYGGDGGLGIAVDDQGNAYVTGNTRSSETTFPVAVGPDLTYNGTKGGDAFVAKVNATGTGLVYCGYIGGEGTDRGGDIAVDNQGNAYVTGGTASRETTFPVTVGPDLTYNGGNWDAFVAKVNATGTGLVYCGYIGGTGGGPYGETGTGIAVDGQGNTYVIGNTDSTETTFPVAVGPDLTYNGGKLDPFVAKVNATGTGLEYCGYIGGADWDYGYAIAVDVSGNAYVTGETDSTETTFPVTVGPDLTANSDKWDAFVAKVNATGTGLEYCGYIGGEDWDNGYAIAVDVSGNAYVTGSTRSSEATFPVTVGPDLTYNGGQVGDAFVAKVNATGTGLEYCGYIGGAGSEWCQGIAVDNQGYAYVIGFTGSTEATFPVAVGPDLTYNGGGEDPFVAKVNATGTGLVYCGYIGGAEGIEEGTDIAVDDQGNAYVTGYTDSTETTFPVAVGPDLTHNSDNWNAFVAKISSDASPTPTACFTYSPNNPTTQDVVQFSDCSTDADGMVVAWAWNFGDETDPEDVQTPTHRYNAKGYYSASLTVTDNDGDTDTCTKLIPVSYVVQADGYKPSTHGFAFANKYFPGIVNMNVCTGIALTSLLYYVTNQDVDVPSGCNSKATVAPNGCAQEPAGVPLPPPFSNCWVSDKIFCLHWAGNAFLAPGPGLGLDWNNVDANEEYNKIKQYIASGVPTVVALGPISLIPPVGGHCVTAWKVEEEPDGTNWVYVYDPNVSSCIGDCDNVRFKIGDDFSSCNITKPKFAALLPGAWNAPADKDELGSFLLQKARLFLGTLDSPVDMVITDPDGLTLSKTTNEIPGGIYLEADFDGDGDLEDLFMIPGRKMGTYIIKVIPEPGATPDDTFTLQVCIGGGCLLIVENVCIADIPDEPYRIEVTEEGIELVGGTCSPSQFINFGPNPVPSEGCIFWLDLPDDTVDATLKIFDIDGALLVSIPLDATADRYPAAGRWLPEDDLGRLLGTGLYLYLVEIEHTDGTVTYSPVQKMVIKR